jgi:hypothetical protein
LTADTIETKMNASGSVELAGETDAHEVDIRGSGSLHAGDLQSSEAVVAIRASGSATVYATDKLDASISGSGMCPTTATRRRSPSPRRHGQVLGAKRRA